MVVINTDISGVMTADPGIVDNVLPGIYWVDFSNLGGS